MPGFLWVSKNNRNNKKCKILLKLLQNQKMAKPNPFTPKSGWETKTFAGREYLNVKSGQVAKVSKVAKLCN
jgi:hypothetical protein